MKTKLFEGKIVHENPFFLWSQAITCPSNFFLGVEKKAACILGGQRLTGDEVETKVEEGWQSKAHGEWEYVSHSVY